MILAAVQTGPGSGRRARSPQGGNLSPVPCRHLCLKPCCLLLPVRHSFPLAPRTWKYTVQPMRFHPVPKRMPRKIRYARPVACQGGQDENRTRPAIYKAFTACLLHLYRPGFPLNTGRSPHRRLAESDPGTVHRRAPGRCLLDHSNPLGSSMANPGGAGNWVYAVDALESAQADQALKRFKASSAPSSATSAARSSGIVAGRPHRRRARNSHSLCIERR